MKCNFSVVTLSMCRASLKKRLDEVNDFIRLIEDVKGETPYNLIGVRNDLIASINELENAIYS